LVLASALIEPLLMTLRARLWPLEGVALTDAKKSGGLLDQYNLLGAIIDSPWATRLDHKVARHVIDRYYPKHGNGRASLRYLEQATGSSRSNITTSLRRLAENGAIIITRQGQGTRPTEFALNFEFPASVPVDMTSSNDVPSVPVGVTPSGHVDDTSSASSVPVGVTESYLLNPAYKAEIQIDIEDTRPPMAPLLADGLSATAARGSAVEELASSPAQPTFELLWRTYGKERAGGKKEARAAWKALSPDADLAAIIEAATAWRGAWLALNDPKRPRYTLARWLADERYDQDAPTGFTKVEKASKAKPAKDKPGINIRRYRITDYQTEGSPFADFFEIFTFEGEDGTMPFTHRLHVLKLDTENADDAPDYYAKHQLCRAAFGKGNPEGDYIGRVIGMNSDKDGIMFHHLPDVIQPEPAPEPVAPARVQRTLTLEEAQADYDAWYEASLEEDEAA
jgi:hypothetical protein